MKEQALTVIKKALDMGVESGVYKTLDNISNIIAAFNYLVSLEEPKQPLKAVDSTNQVHSQ